MPAEVQVGRSDGWLLNDRIRLIDPLRKSPAPAGLFYVYAHTAARQIARCGYSSAMSARQRPEIRLVIGISSSPTLMSPTVLMRRLAIE